MAQFTLTIPDANVTEVIDALCKAGGYDVVSDANAKAAVIDWITATVRNVQTVHPAPIVPASLTGLS